MDISNFNGTLVIVDLFSFIEQKRLSLSQPPSSSPHWYYYAIQVFHTPYPPIITGLIYPLPQIPAPFLPFYVQENARQIHQKPPIHFLQ